jgi:phage shock protein A
MEQRTDDLTGMGVPDAREYILAHSTTLKLNERKLSDLEQEGEKWRNRVALARSKGEEALAQEAEKEAARISAQEESLRTETEQQKAQIKRMVRQLPGLAARERTIDPDLLEQELLMAAGLSPGDEDKLAQNRQFAALEKEAAADVALAALKAKLNRDDAHEAGTQPGAAGEGGSGGNGPAGEPSGEGEGSPEGEGRSGGLAP